MTVNYNSDIFNKFFSTPAQYSKGSGGTLLASAPDQYIPSNTLEQTSSKETFIKKNGKKILAFTGIALAVGFGALYCLKKHKVRSIQPQTENIGNDAPVQQIKKYFMPEIKSKEVMDVPYEASSVQDDVQNWLDLRSKSPKTFTGLGGKKYPINQELNNGFEIKPHNYADDTSVFILKRSAEISPGYATYKVENGYMQKCEDIHSSMPKMKGYYSDPELQKNGFNLQTGHFDDGKKYVSIDFMSGDYDEGGRRGNNIIMLVSDGDSFTQSQKDLIKIANGMVTNDEKFARIISNPFDLASITKRKEYSLLTDREVHKNTLLSVIYSWAERFEDFSVDKLIDDIGDTFFMDQNLKKFVANFRE